MRKDITSFTAPGGGLPSYVNVSRADCGGVAVTVREPPIGKVDQLREGKTAIAVIPAEDWRRMVREAAFNF